MADYLDDYTDIPADQVASETFNDEKKNQDRVLSATTILLQIDREFSKRFLEEVFQILHWAVLTSSYYMNELST